MLKLQQGKEKVEYGHVRTNLERDIPQNIFGCMMWERSDLGKYRFLEGGDEKFCSVGIRTDFPELVPPHSLRQERNLVVIAGPETEEMKSFIETAPYRVINAHDPIEAAKMRKLDFSSELTTASKDASVFLVPEDADYYPWAGPPHVFGRVKPGAGPILGPRRGSEPMEEARMFGFYRHIASSLHASKAGGVWLIKPGVTRPPGMLVLKLNLLDQPSLFMTNPTLIHYHLMFLLNSKTREGGNCCGCGSAFRMETVSPLIREPRALCPKWRWGTFGHDEDWALKSAIGTAAAYLGDYPVTFDPEFPEEQKRLVMKERRLRNMAREGEVIWLVWRSKSGTTTFPTPPLFLVTEALETRSKPEKRHHVQVYMLLPHHIYQSPEFSDFIWRMNQLALWSFHFHHGLGKGMYYLLQARCVGAHEAKAALALDELALGM
jgi:hypothetical protein